MSIKQYIKSLRRFRVIHRFVGTTVAVLVLISAVTGILLALKKEVPIIQPPTQKGISQDLSQWKSLDELSRIGKTAFYVSHPDQKGNAIDRIDVRPSKGIIKILFEKGNWEVQVDATDGKIKSIARRHSDWIEALHDGSIVSHWFKLLSMNTLGLGLLFLLFTGLWLWYGPKQIRKLKKRR